MAIYSFPLAAVLVAAALHDNHNHTTRHMEHLRTRRDTAAAGFQTMEQDRVGRETLLLLERQFIHLRRTVCRLRVKCELERSAVTAQLHEADAQVALAQLRYNIERAELARTIINVDFLDHIPLIPTKIGEIPASTNETAVIAAFQRLEDQITRKVKLLERAHLHKSIREDLVVDLHASLEMLQRERDTLQTRHYVQLGAMYDALVTKRLRLRALHVLIQRVRALKRAAFEDTYAITHELTHALTSKLNLKDDVDDDISMAMLEDLNDDSEASYDADVDDDDTEDVYIAYEEASI